MKAVSQCGEGSRMLDALADLRTVHNRANFLDTVVKGASVHKGFYLQLVDMYPSLCEAIESLTTRPGEDSSIVQRIYVTGHSLGGAIASIGACMLAKKFAAADVSSITFASPRAGNAQFDAAFATLVSTSLRFVYNYDAVPTVPMPYLGFPACGSLLLAEAWDLPQVEGWYRP
eukprot:jgi/Botrbrau1/17506/Bobra.0054s0082.1